MCETRHEAADWVSSPSYLLEVRIENATRMLGCEGDVDDERGSGVERCRPPGAEPSGDMRLL